MTFGGWITFLISTGAVASLFIWCLMKVLSAKRPENDDIGAAFDLFEDGKEHKKSTKK